MYTSKYGQQARVPWLFRPFLAQARDPEPSTRTTMEQNRVYWASVRKQTPEQNRLLLGLPRPATMREGQAWHAWRISLPSSRPLLRVPSPPSAGRPRSRQGTPCKAVAVGSASLFLAPFPAFPASPTVPRRACPLMSGWLANGANAACGPQHGRPSPRGAVPAAHPFTPREPPKAPIIPPGCLQSEPHRSTDPLGSLVWRPPRPAPVPQCWNSAARRRCGTTRPRGWAAASAVQVGADPPPDGATAGGRCAVGGSAHRIIREASRGPLKYEEPTPWS